MKRDDRVWPFTPLGTVVMVPLMGAAMMGGIYGFFWLVQFLGDIALGVS